MDFKRLPTWMLAPVSLCVCGGLLVLALQAQLYACAVVLGLAAAWIAASVREASAAPPVGLVPRIDASNAMQWRLFNAALDQIPAPLLLMETSGAPRAANRAARALFRADDRLVLPPPALIEALGADPREGRLTVNLDVQGQARTYAMSMIDITGPDGPRRIAMLLDIQPEIRAAEAAALRELMQVLSHEIMNALTPVGSLAATAVDLLSEANPESIATARDAVETLARRAEGLGRFVEAYRTLARLPPPTLRPTSVAALLDETARLFRSRWSGVGLEVAKPNPDLTASLDMDLMVHALTNILSNAADAALSGRERQPSVALSARETANGLVFAVTDSGPGISAEDRERVFQPFFTTKASGTGVGLSFARQVALSHGGDLSLAPRTAGAGATFQLTL